MPVRRAKSNASFDAVEFLKREGERIVSRLARSHREVEYAELRFETTHGRTATAENGEFRSDRETESVSLGIGVHVRGAAGLSGHGHCGREMGPRIAGPAALARTIKGEFEAAFERARLNARHKADLVKNRAPEQAALMSILAERLWTDARSPIHGRAEARFEHDPSSVTAAQLRALCRESSAAVAGIGAAIAFNTVAVMTELRREVFINSEGSLIEQDFAFSQGDCHVVAEDAEGHFENFDTIGQQRGIECLLYGWSDELAPNASLVDFALELAREACDLAKAPSLKPPRGEVAVVTDPHFNALLAHEIVGHPSEADRALKMEAAYAGRSWFLRSLDHNEASRRVGSPLLSACSNPLIEGYGHYRYDHEGTPARRVVHIDRGIFRDFLNSRATAAVLGASPNGSCRATEAHLVPLVRMSNTFFMPGEADPRKIIEEVDRGYYVCGSRIPSIAESRENFRISARRIYEIEHGRLGRLCRGGSLMGDSKRFFMNVDAVGNDPRLFAIPNCGKGQPMQVKRMGNGGPTLRSRAFLTGG